MPTPTQAANDIRDNLADDLGGDRTTDLTTKLGALETALTAFLDAATDHNSRVAYWRQQMLTAGAYQATADFGDQRWERTGDGLALAATSTPGTVTKAYRPLPTGSLLGAVLARTLGAYDHSARRFAGGTQLCPGDEWLSSTGRVNLTALIQKDA